MTSPRPPAWGAWLFIAGAALSFGFALRAYFLAWGIKFTPGSLIVVLATAILLLAALALAFLSMPKWLRGLLQIGVVADLLGTALAAYFLEASGLIACIVLAGICWLAWIVTGSARASQPERRQPA